MTPQPLALSVVLPSFRAADVATDTVAELKMVLDASFLRGQWEIIVVDDGGGDFPPQWHAGPTVSLIRLAENYGKGMAVRTGMARASGRARIYTDVDLPYDPWLIPVMAEYLLSDGFHMVVGDRTLTESSLDNRYTYLRRSISSVATFVIGTLVTGGFFDTQCGLKGLRGDVAELIFPMVRTDRFVFDVELVYLALRFNCTIKRIPVTTARVTGGSTVRPIVDSIRSFVDLLRIKGRSMRHAYECEPLRRLVDAPFRHRLTDAPDTYRGSIGDESK
jgi:dolichyl-phosphate beta-glucosyltransferase